MTVTSDVVGEVLQANGDYAVGFSKGDLPMPPARRFAVVACMDARIVPAKALGLEEGDAHVIRNAGGLASDDALRTQEAIVVGHTDCGVLTFTNDSIHAKLHDDLGADASDTDCLPFADVEAAVRESVAKIAETPLLPDTYTERGYVYEVGSGRLREVV
jgi:carbonic anhydrase